jgi:pimeloyl-ACP methyl ester carboxylesterase
MPDLPGFGGMQSFYKIGEKPTIDTFADYLAAFIKLRYKSKRLTIVGVAFGFVVVTRMLQHDPDLAKRVDIVISLGGVARYDDLAFNPAKRLGYRLGTRLLATRPLSLFVRHVCWHPVVLNAWYSRQNPPAPNATAEIALWRRNNVRTHFMTLAALFKLDNCQQAVAVPLFHLALVSNKQIDNQHTIQHLHVIFPRVDVARSRLKSKYIGTIDYHSSARLLPAKLRRLLAS